MLDVNYSGCRRRRAASASPKKHTFMEPVTGEQIGGAHCAPETRLGIWLRLRGGALGPLFLLILLFPCANGAWADDAAKDTPTGFWERCNLLGDMGGLRTCLGNYGITFSLIETAKCLEM